MGWALPAGKWAQQVPCPLSKGPHRTCWPFTQPGGAAGTGEGLYPAPEEMGGKRGTLGKAKRNEWLQG